VRWLQPHGSAANTAICPEGSTLSGGSGLMGLAARIAPRPQGV
jgi:hypothetical protein